MLYFFLVLAFGTAGEYRGATMVAEPAHDWGTCMAQRDEYMSHPIVPVIAGEHQEVTVCFEENLTALPRCYTEPPQPHRRNSNDLLG